MYPYYHMHTGLSSDDIAAIQQLYPAQASSQQSTSGAPSTPTTPSAPSTPSTPSAPSTPSTPSTPGTPASTPQPSPATPLLLLVQVPPASTAASSIALTGALSGGTGTVALTWSTNQGFSGTAQASSNWTISAIPLNAGANIITITARDSLQNQVTQTVTVTDASVPAPNPPAPPSQPSPGSPDTTPPSLTIVSPASSTFSTSASSIVVSGTASDNVGVANVTWNSSTGGSGTATGTTNWSTPSIPIYIGTTTIVIQASDTAGNTSWRSLVVTRN